MATGYTIEIGYMSGSGWREGHDKAWEALKEAAESIAYEPTKLATEARNFGAPFYCCSKRCSTIFEYAQAYSKDWRDGGPLMVVTKPDDLGSFKQDEFRPHLHISASGGDESRDMKEHVARAFVRLLMAEMHRKGIEINVRVG